MPHVFVARNTALLSRISQFSQKYVVFPSELLIALRKINWMFKIQKATKYSLHTLFC